MAEPLLGLVLDNPVGQMGLAFLTAQLGDETIGGVIDSLDPAELDEWLAIGIDLLARLRSDTAAPLICESEHGARYAAGGWNAGALVPVLEDDGNAIVAKLVVAISGPDLHHGGNLDG